MKFSIDQARKRITEIGKEAVEKAKLFLPSHMSKQAEIKFLTKCVSYCDSIPHKQLLVMRLMGCPHSLIAKKNGVPERIVRKMEDEALEMIKQKISKDPDLGLTIDQIEAKKNYQKKIQITT